MNADAEAIIEQALRFVLDEQAKLLKRDDAAELKEIILTLNKLALKTQAAIANGISRLKNVEQLIKEARAVEQLADDLSEKIWRFTPVPVCSVYEKLDRALRPSEDKYGAAAELRSHYQGLRIRLLEQTLGARQLESNSDLGLEMERIWQQFLQRNLGPSVRVLTGGIISDYQGNTSKHQIDLIVVPAEAHVTFPGDSDGKAHVPIDQVISAIMIKSTLKGADLRDDWEALRDIPSYPQMLDDHPSLAPPKKGRPHAWPLRYIIGSQSDPIESLKAIWEKAVAEQAGPVPELVVTLDSGFLYSGGSCWPRPRFPGNYTEPDQVMTQTGPYSGLGLAWLITQHQGRLAVIQRRAVGPIQRQAESLDMAMLTQSTPYTHSMKFDSMFRMREIAGNFKWGSTSTHAHNRLPLNTIEKTNGRPLCLPEYNPEKAVYPDHAKGVRWFRYPAYVIAGNLLALEEWLEPKELTAHKRRIAVFDTRLDQELIGPEVDALEQVDQVSRLAQAPPSPVTT
ncbi:MAG: hypothetical protein LV479_02680 [Methylacidiphilales bacterium]|nr:hypothetical protein [Candidatus Methylacidiphilales bacterium]